MSKAKRNERDAKSGQYVKSGTEKRRPAHTVTEPRSTRRGGSKGKKQK